MTYWLMKSEPGDYSIDDLERDRMEPWDGIRNYQVRNMIRDDMAIGDEVLFYHSSCKVPGVVGLAKIVSAVRSRERTLRSREQGRRAPLASQGCRLRA